MSVIVIEGSNGVGKTTLINNMALTYDFISLKSVPDWYQKYIPFARSLPPEDQKKVYMIGHEANYTSLNNKNNYILDRFFYSTIIRLNYEEDMTISNTVSEIMNIKIMPDIIIYLKASKSIVFDRLSKRNGTYLNDDYYEYENEVFDLLSKKYDRIVIVDNSNTIDATTDEVIEKLRTNKIFLMRR